MKCFDDFYYRLLKIHKLLNFFFVSFSFSSLFLFVNHMDVRRHFSLVRQYVATMLFNMLPYCHMRTFFHLFFCLAFIAFSFLSFCRWIHWCPNSNRIKEPSLTRIICLLVKKLHITIYIIAGCYRNSDAQRMLVVRISPNRIFAVDDVHLDTMWKFSEFCRFLMHLGPFWHWSDLLKRFRKKLICF